MSVASSAQRLIERHGFSGAISRAGRDQQLVAEINNQAAASTAVQASPMPKPGEEPLRPFAYPSNHVSRGVI